MSPCGFEAVAALLQLTLQLHKNVGRIANPSLKYRAIPIEVEGR
jgi:hypothetical protein